MYLSRHVRFTCNDEEAGYIVSESFVVNTVVSNSFQYNIMNARHVIHYGKNGSQSS